MSKGFDSWNSNLALEKYIYLRKGKKFLKVMDFFSNGFVLDFERLQETVPRSDLLVGCADHHRRQRTPIASRSEYSMKQSYLDFMKIILLDTWRHHFIRYLTSSIYLSYWFPFLKIVILQDNLVTLQTMLVSPHLAENRSKAETWSSHLHQLKEILDLWINCQQKVSSSTFI